MDLTWPLLALAAVVIVAIGVQGWWMARGPRPRPDPAPPPVLTERVDPPMDTQPAPPPPEVRLAALRRVPRLDALIDAIAPLTLESPASGEFLLSHAPASRRAGSKAFYIEGLDSETGTWEPLQPGHRYGELQAGVQLASRSGPLNEIEYSEFVQKLQAFAEAVNALPELPDMLDVVARARELDAFASPRDAQLTLTLKSEAVAWSLGFIQQCAARHGFVPGAVPGRLVLPAAEEGDPPVLVLSYDAQAALAEDPQQAAVRECQLSLDVPQTAASAEPFPAWHNAARKLADDLAAVVVDDYGEPISVHAFAAIDQELAQLYTQLEARDLAAGSPAARRLFS
ncbi:MAG: cell division protein FtsZ [Rubrivivax sp.]|nr:cell division protein FtsZ [Rubrivivax sp.]